MLLISLFIDFPFKFRARCRCPIFFFFFFFLGFMERYGSKPKFYCKCFRTTIKPQKKRIRETHGDIQSKFHVIQVILFVLQSDIFLKSKCTFDTVWLALFYFIFVFSLLPFCFLFHDMCIMWYIFSVPEKFLSPTVLVRK